jgi:hypothetical protein
MRGGYLSEFMIRRFQVEVVKKRYQVEIMIRRCQVFEFWISLVVLGVRIPS